MSSQLRSFTRAVGKKDPEGIAASSARLAAESDKISDILYYTSKLSDFVIREAKSRQGLDYEERIQLARREWSRLKKKEGLKDDPVITNAIVSAVAKAIGKGRK